MEELDELRREFERVSAFTSFDSSGRIWWIYFRSAVERWLERDEDPGIRAAFDIVKSFPENLPDERRHWHDLRAAVGKVLGS
jgi:hypothetical protein